MSQMRRAAASSQAGYPAAYAGTRNRGVPAVPASEPVAGAEHRAVWPHSAEHDTERSQGTDHLGPLAAGGAGLHGEYRRAADETLRPEFHAGAHSPALETLAGGSHQPVPIHRFHRALVEHRSVHDLDSGRRGAIRKSHARATREWCGRLRRGGRRDHARLALLRPSRDVGRHGHGRMSEIEAATPSARQRRRRFSWIWIVPLLAAAVVIGLAIRAFAERGPLITISFSDAEGIEAGDTKVRHKDVDLGTVESIYLNREMSRVFVRARMRRSVTDHLTSDARFWIVRPRVGAGGISGLSTIVSGSYIEMYPGSGDKQAQRSFVGLDDPPALTPDIPGRSFTLRTDDLGSLTAGSPVSYRGLPVGEIEGYELDPSGKQISVYAFVRAPFERYVTSQTRFWNSGGIDLAVGVQGLRFRASSWQQLISGGVSFDTPEASLNSAEAKGGAVFQLYENQYDAQRDPRGATLHYLVTFTGDAGEIGTGTAVQLQGTEI